MSARRRLPDRPFGRRSARLFSQDDAQALREVTMESMIMLEEGDCTTVLAGRDRCVAIGVVSEPEPTSRTRASVALGRHACHHDNGPESICVRSDVSHD
jgi:hypothetical protein